MELQPEATSPPPPPRQPKTYELTAAGISYTKSTASTTALLFKPISTPIPSSSRRHILRDITFTAHPSEILAIVGPSGAGKSTLIDILAARTAPSGGSLLLNSAPLSPSSFRKLSAHVPQHDAGLLLPLLTVAETFSFAARLLLPSGGDDIISSILSDLRLSHLSHVLLGSSRRGLSGGELRRVSIGLGLLHDPAVLLLDEPTSGLDSHSALNVVHVLRSVCLSRRRTLVLSIHQPSFKILSLIDKILLLHAGSVVHHGTLTSLQAFLLCKGFTVPPQLNALEYAMEVINQIHQNDDDTDNKSVGPPVQATPRNDDDDIVVLYRSSRLQEVMVLYSRLWRVIYRTRQLLVTNTLEALIVGLVLGTIYIDIGYGKEGIEKRFGLFAFTLTFLLSSTTEALPIFINERPVILRETSGGVYRLSSYLVANTLVFLPYLLAIALIYSVSLYFLVGLCATWQAFAYFVLVIWIVVLMANSFVLFVSSLAPNFITGTSLVTVLLGAFFLFSGYFISQDGMPKYWLFMHFMSMYKYALDALLINEYGCLVSTCLIWYEENKECMVTGRDVMDKRGLHESQRWTNIYVLIGFFVLYRLLSLLLLIRRVSRSKN